MQERTATLTRETKVKEWTELCSYEGEPRYNSNWVFRIYKTVNISEYETVDIENEIFRADLNEMHLHTNKIVEERDINKEENLHVGQLQTALETISPVTSAIDEGSIAAEVQLSQDESKEV